MATIIPDESLLEISSQSGGGDGSNFPLSYLPSEWSTALKQDYVAKGNFVGQGNDSLIKIAGDTYDLQVATAQLQVEVAALEVQVAQNVIDIGTNATNIGINTGNITTNTTNIGTNATNISTNTGNITTNTTNIGTNATNIGTNTTNIGTNTTNITTNATDIADTLLQTGVVDPEGVITANRLGIYARTDAPNKAIWINTTQGINTGWIQITALL